MESGCAMEMTTAETTVTRIKVSAEQTVRRVAGYILIIHRTIRQTRYIYIHRGPLKKGATFIFTITLANVDRFQ